MSEVEQLAQEQFNTFKTRLCEILSEIEEEHKSAFIQGYAKGETDEMFRTTQVISKHFVDLEKENKALKEENEKLQVLLDVQNFLIEPKNKEKKEHLQQNGWVEITMPCSKEDARDCLTKQEGLCESTDGLCRIKINLSRLCKC